MPNFVHLHVHTQYSLLEAAIRLPTLFQRLTELDMKSVAITDYNNLFGAVEFFSQAKKAGIKPIIGCEITLFIGVRRDHRVQPRKLSHLILLVLSRLGYENLCRLVTEAHLGASIESEGLPLIEKETLAKYAQGLIALTGGLKGEIPQLLLGGHDQKAHDVLKWYHDIFGDRLYLEMQDHGYPEDKILNQKIYKLSKKSEVPVVATNDCHYLLREQAKAHEVLRCIQKGKTLQDKDRPRFKTDEFYLKSAAEMEERFQFAPEALEHTLEIADRCHFKFDFSKIDMPQYAPPPGKTLDDFLEQRAYAGLTRRLEAIRAKIAHAPEEFEKLRVEYENRLREELKIIQQMGFSGYFLIVADFVGYAKAHDIPVGPGRGSAAGSLVAYALRITEIDPIEHHLIFERFLNPERVSLPDMDIDFCQNRRAEVLSYVTERYGTHHVAQIITFGKLQAKAVIRDVGRAFGMPYLEVDRIAKLIPNQLNITLKEALEHPDFKKLYEGDRQIHQLIDTAQDLEGLYRHASIHAAGVVISNRPLIESMPLFRGRDGEVVTQYDMKDLEKIGLIKFDFLGLKTLTLIQEATQLIRQRHLPDFNIETIPYDDKEIFSLLSRGDTLGVFQLESPGMRDLLMRLKPSSFQDIIAANALFRPGPMGRVDEFIARKHGRIPIQYEHPAMQPILHESYGVILYQEQVMKIANALAHFSLGEADILRRAMGKKNPVEMAKQKERFLSGAGENHIPVHLAEKIFDLMAKFAEYGFNKSHSSAYALVAYQTAYLKHYYYREFLAALLNSEMDNTDKIALYVQDGKAHKVALLPPDVNKSQYGFTVLDESICFGLGAIKNVGGTALEVIFSARKKYGKFESLANFCEKVDLKRVSRKVIECLIKGGAFDSLCLNRAHLMENIEDLYDRSLRSQRDKKMGQMSIFTKIPSAEKDKTSEIEREDWPMRKRLLLEKETLGLYVTGHPLQQEADIVRQWSTHDSTNVHEVPEREKVRLCGIVQQIKEIYTRKGDKMALVTLEDLSGTVGVVVFSELYQKVHALLGSTDPLYIEGAMNHQGTNVKVVAEVVERLSHLAKRSPKEVHFFLSAFSGEREVPRLRELLSKHRQGFEGSCPIYLHLVETVDQGIRKETVIEVGDEFRVNPKEGFLRDFYENFTDVRLRFI